MVPACLSTSSYPLYSIPSILAFNLKRLPLFQAFLFFLSLVLWLSRYQFLGISQAHKSFPPSIFQQLKLFLEKISKLLCMATIYPSASVHLPWTFLDLCPMLCLAFTISKAPRPSPQGHRILWDVHDLYQFLRYPQEKSTRPNFRPFPDRVPMRSKAWLLQDEPMQAAWMAECVWSRLCSTQADGTSDASIHVHVCRPPFPWQQGSITRYGLWLNWGTPRAPAFQEPWRIRARGKAGWAPSNPSQKKA